MHNAQISMQEALENPFVASMLPCGFRTTVKHYIKKGSQKSLGLRKKGNVQLVNKILKTLALKTLC